MISSKFLASTALAASVVVSIGLAYAQTTVPTPDSARVESNRATSQPGTDGTTVTTQGSTGAAASTTTTTANIDTTATPMRDDAAMRTERAARADRN